MSRWGLLVSEWKDCERCELATTRRRVVFGRGKLPADVLFIGEGPGASEDVSGQAFDGPAGEVLDDIIDRAGWGKRPDYLYRLFFGNLVACIPKDAGNNKIHEPDHDHVMACKPRLEATAEMVAPRLIVLVGKCAREYTDPTWRDAVKLPAAPRVEILHPSSILHAQTANKSLLAQRCVVTLRDAARKWLG